jgi:hypothetical protein
VSATQPDGALHLHVDLYPRAAIDAAVGAFSRFGPIAVELRAPYHRVVLPRAADGSGVLAREFANYVLAAAALARARPSRDAGA